MAAIEARKANLTIKLVDHLKQNEELLKGKRKDRVGVDALEKELGKVQKSLDNARLILLDLDNLYRNIEEFKGKTEGPEA